MLHAKHASKQNKAVDGAINLGEEEIVDVSLATFYVFDTEDAATRGQRLVRAAGGCGCGGGCGCARGCGGSGCGS
jgi:hypothetical protein